MKTKFKYIVLGSLLFGLSGFNIARAITVPELIDALLQFQAEVLQSFTEVNETLGDHETRVSDNEDRIRELVTADFGSQITELESRIASLEAEPKTTIAVTEPTLFDDINAGLTEGSVWIDTSTSKAYILVDNTANAAVWTRLGPPDPPALYAIGDSGPAGGIVFYVTNGGQHGLEAAPEDQTVPFGPGVEWGCHGNVIPGMGGYAIGTGTQNTTAILAGCATSGIAARLADDYTLNGFDDWFLPSEDELNELYFRQGVVGGFAPSVYWSSTQSTSVDAADQSFVDGFQWSNSKSTQYQVRAVRAF